MQLGDVDVTVHQICHVPFIQKDFLPTQSLQYLHEVTKNILQISLDEKEEGKMISTAENKFL